jgi:hypothetical protein
MHGTPAHQRSRRGRSIQSRASDRRDRDRRRKKHSSPD